MPILASWVQFAGCIQLGILAAALHVPRVVRFRENLAAATPFFRRLVWVYSAFIVLVIAGFGLVSLFHAEDLVSGTPLARWVCLFIAVFWLVRLAVQFFVFDSRPFRHSRFLIAGYHSLTAAFLYLVTVYALTALWP